ncbi:MAG: ABC transporter substrate-binding protein [Alphaproteobacteria bacterium]|nr:ABC transporter substrate-binding protein [Alphaproteobacteria bacterium]
MSTPSRRTVGRRQAGLGSLALGALVGLPRAAAAQAAVDRKDTLIVEAWPPGPTYRNHGNLNPFAVGNDPRNHIAFVYEALYFWNNLKGEHIPFLATSHQFNADNTEVVVKLRQGVTWADGKPFTADDVVTTFEMLRQNGEGKKDLFLATDVSADLAATEKVDGLTVKFKLKRPDPRFVLRTLTVRFNKGIFILPAHVLATVADPAAFTNFDLDKGLPIGTGPYKVVASTPERVVMDRRDDWWGAKPGVWTGAQANANYTDLPAPRRLITVPRGEQQQMAQQLAGGQIDWMVEAPVPIMKRLLEQYPQITTLTDRKVPYGHIDWWPTSVFFNLDAPAMADVRVRRAMAYAINPKQVIDIFHDGAADQAYTPYPDFPVLRPYVKDIEEVAKAKGVGSFDPRRSQALMSEAGYVKDGEGLWSKDGKRVEYVLTAATALEAMAPVVTQQLRRQGFDVQFTRRPDALQVIYGGKTDLVLFGHGGSVFDPEDTMLLYHSKFYRPVGEITTRFHRWRNKRFDELTDQVAVLPVNDARLRPIVKEAFSLWAEEAVEVPIAQWYHRIPFNTTYWTNWPSEADPYQSPTVSYWTTMLVVHGLKQRA